MSKYNLEYKGVKCTDVEWEDYIFHFEYLDKEYVFEQAIEVSANADTDHIRIVIEEQFLPFVKELLKMEKVRKDTAREILKELKNQIEREISTFAETDKDFNYGLDIALGKVSLLANEYGIKVE